MNETLQGKLVEILTSVQTATKAAGDFTLTQLPDIAQSYIMYGRAVHTMWFLVGMTTLTLIVVNWKRIWDTINSSDHPGEFIGLMFGTVIGGAMTLINVSPMLLVWFAPKVWLLLELSRLMGGKG